MTQGFFAVAPNSTETDITFQMSSSVSGDVPGEQATLVTEIERALRVLRAVFEERNSEFRRYFRPLVSLAQGGLVGAQAQPQMALRALVELKQEVLEREAGRVKNQHMLRLGRAAAYFATPALILALLSRSAATFPILLTSHGVITASVLSNVFFLVAGCAVGVWISFGARKALLTFEDLSVPETDFLMPITRLVFAELLTITIGLLFQLRVVEVQLGPLSTADIFDRPLVSLLVGILAGFSEQVLSKQLASQAGRLFDSSAR